MKYKVLFDTLKRERNPATEMTPYQRITRENPNISSTTIMKFGKIFRFELSYQLRHVIPWLLMLALVFFGFWVLRIVTLIGDTHLNAPGTIAFFSVFGTTMWLLAGGGIAGDAATRDVQTRMHPLTYTTPLSKLSYLGARFLAALLLNATILLALHAGFLLSVYGPGARTELMGPFRLASYLTAYGFITFPIVFVATAVQFTLAALSGRAIAGYVGSFLLLIISQFVGTTVKYGLGWKLFGSLLYLLGIGIVAEMEAWTPSEKNTRLILLEGTWLWNRVMWFGVASSALAITYFRYRLAHVTQGVSWWSRMRFSKRSAPTGNLSVDLNAIELPYIKRDFAFTTHLRQAGTVALASFSMIATSRSGLTLVGIIAIGTGLFATEYMQFLGVPLFARTEEVLRVLTPSLSTIKTQWLIIPLLIIFYAGELIWREREAGLNELSDSTPAPEWVMFLGKFSGLALVIITWVAFMMAAGIINQLTLDYYNFEIDVYIKALFGIQLTNYLLFALLMLVIHVLANQKYIGHMIAFCAYGSILFASMIGIDHHMLVYASDPGWSYSDMRGFGPYIKPWLWFKFYWGSCAFLLAIIATLFWARSKESGFKARFHLAKARLLKYKSVSAIALGLVLISGGFVFYNTNVLNRYLSASDRIEHRADYEKRYGKYEYATQPVVVATNLHVEVYPENGAAEIRGTYSLVNRSKVAIDSIHLSTLPHQRVVASFDAETTPVVFDENLGYRIYSLKHPLRPGDSVRMAFELHVKPQGFTNDGIDAAVVGNGSHITSDWMPKIGYNENKRLHDPRDREEYGLPPRLARPTLKDVKARNDARYAQPMRFEAVVGTAKDQIAVAPGALQRSWIEGDDRQYFHYITDAPIQNGYAVFSAKYAVWEEQWLPSPDSSQGIKPVAKPIAIQIFHHPTHDANIARMIKSAQASLDYYSREFGPYPYSHFRVLERPGPGRGMHAEPMTIDYQEGYSLMDPNASGLDLPYHIMSHEVAHQWWGFQLAPAAVEGIGLLVESLATYSAMQVVEETLGYEHLLKYLEQMRQEYEVPRSPAMPALLRSNNSFLNYRKGPFALFAMRNYIGKDKVNDAMRAMIKNYSHDPPLPTTLDFYRELQAVTPDSLQYLLHDLFATNTLWELKTEQATATETEDGSWQVALDVDTHKIVVDSMGMETNIPMNDWIEIGIYANDASSEQVLYLQKHRIRTGKQTITLNVRERPGRAGIDPNSLMIDFDLEDNTRNVKDGEKEEDTEPDLI